MRMRLLCFGAMGLLGFIVAGCAVEAAGPAGAAPSAIHTAALAARGVPLPEPPPPWPVAPTASAGRGCECYGTGDADLDGRLTAADAQRAFAFAMGTAVPTPAERCAADCNGDGTVTARDAQYAFAAFLGFGFCPRDLPLGACCEERIHCASGECLDGFCDTLPVAPCASAADCPPEYTVPPLCGDVATCQGFRVDPVCLDGICHSVNVPDDSACGPSDLASACGLFADIRCTGAVEQTRPPCLTQCSAAGDCDPFIVCVDGVCSNECRLRVDPRAAAPEPDGLTWETAFGDIQTALDTAGSLVQAGLPWCEVWVAGGAYQPGPAPSDSVQLRPFVHLYGGFAGDETARDQRDVAANPTVLDGHSVNLNVVIAADQSVVDGFTISGGAATGPWYGACRGGGLFSAATGGARVANCHFEGNTAVREGGAIAIQDGVVHIENCTFQDNSAPRGGALHIGGTGGAVVVGCDFHENVGDDGGALLHSSTSGSPSELRFCTFTDNFAPVRGGAAAFSDGARANVDWCTFEGNRTAGQGGAILATNNTEVAVDLGVFFMNEAGTGGGGVFAEYNAVQVERSLFVGNVTDTGNGGALHQSRGQAILGGCTFAGNQAPGDGGGLYAYAAQLIVWGSSFRDNAAGGAGGGLSLTYGRGLVNEALFRGNRANRGGGFSYALGTLHLGSSAFYANAADIGGGLYVNHRSAFAVTVTNVTIAANTAQSTGGGAHFRLTPAGGRSATVQNAIFWGNAGGEIDLFSGSLSVQYSDVQGGYVGEGNFEADPLFVDPASGDFHLQPNSPCIDRGNAGGAPTIDADGNLRCDDPDTPNQGIGSPPYVDVGAYEYQAPECSEPPRGVR